MKNLFTTLFSSVTLIATVTIAHAEEIKMRSYWMRWLVNSLAAKAKNWF